MDYISEIKEFEQWLLFDLSKPITTASQALWHTLMHFNNKCAVKIGNVWFWRVTFSVPNSTLCMILRLNKKQLERARTYLVRNKVLIYRPGIGGFCGEYSFLPFDKDVKPYFCESKSIVIWAKEQQIKFTQPILKLCTMNQVINSQNDVSIMKKKIADWGETVARVKTNVSPEVSLAPHLSIPSPVRDTGEAVLKSVTGSVLNLSQNEDELVPNLSPLIISNSNNNKKREYMTIYNPSGNEMVKTYWEREPFFNEVYYIEYLLRTCTAELIGEKMLQVKDHPDAIHALRRLFEKI